MRHDVDLVPYNSLKTAQIEHKLEIRGRYYFRTIKESNTFEIIKQIADLGHEIGCHYEDLSLCKGNMDEAYKSFIKNLEYFRRFYPVKTICMHGSPMSKFDNKYIWKTMIIRNWGLLVTLILILIFQKYCT